MIDIRHSNQNNWKGIFYFNKKDARVFLPKRNPNLGYTVNYGNKYTYILLFCIILFFVLLSI